MDAAARSQMNRYAGDVLAKFLPAREQIQDEPFRKGAQIRQPGVKNMRHAGFPVGQYVSFCAWGYGASATAVADTDGAWLVIRKTPVGEKLRAKEQGESVAKFLEGAVLAVPLTRWRDALPVWEALCAGDAA